MGLGRTVPIRSAFDITPSDSADLTSECRAVYVGGSGDLTVDMKDTGTVTLVGLMAGVWHPIEVTRVYSTGTTATDIVGGY